MSDRSPKNVLEESSSGRNTQSGHLSAPTKSDVLGRTALSNTSLQTKYIGNQEEVTLLGDGISSCGSGGVTRRLSQSAVSRSDSWPARSQQGLPPGGAHHCAVCDQAASGHFFGALVCLPCKSFFIRCTRGGDPCIRQPCYGGCDVKKQFRNRCRYQKCVTVGMSRREKPECVQPEEGQELCQVCGDLANGIHFGVYTCEGCKKFFRRGLKEHQSYVCKGKKKCGLNPRNRNDCRSCRYQKCVKVGMSREAIKMGRPCKPHQSSRISDTELPLETSSMSSDADSNKRDSANNKDNDGGVVVKLEVVNELPAGGSHNELRRTATRFQDAQSRATDSNDARDQPKHQESKGTHAQDQQPSHSYKQREGARSCSSQGNGRTSKDFRKPHDTSLVNWHSVSRTAMRSNSLEASAHATCPPLLSASERVRDDSTRLLERYRNHQGSWSGTDRSETTSGLIEHALEKTFLALDSNKDCKKDGNKQHLIERPYSGAADGDRKVSVLPRAAANHFDLIHTHLEHFLSVSSHILSHYCVENYALLLPEVMVIPLRLSSRLCESEREANLQTTLGNDLSGKVNGACSLNHKSHWQRNLSGESQEATRKMRINSCLDKQHLTDDTPPAKVAKHDHDVVLDLSINSKTQPTDGRTIKTNNSVYNNDECVLRNTVCNSQNSPSRTEQKYEPNCHDSAGAHVPDNTPQHGKSADHVGSGTYTRSVEPFRKRNRSEIVASSFDKHEPSSDTHRQSYSKVFKSPLREIADHFTPTEKSSPCRTLPSLEIKSEMVLPCQRELHALTAIGDQEPHGLLGSEFESATVKHEADSRSYSSNPILPEVLSPSDRPVPPNVDINTTYENNRTSLALGRLNVPPSSLFCDGELSTNKRVSATAPPAHYAAAPPAHVKCLDHSHSLESKESQLLFNVFCANGKSPADCDSDISGPTLREGRKRCPGPNKGMILHINEMYMVADTLTDTLYNSPRRADGHRISRELAAVDEIFADVYGYSPIQVTHFWKDLHSDLSGLNFNKWRGGTLPPPQVGWLRDITRIYSEQVRACEGGAGTPAHSNYQSPALAEGMGRWEHLTKLLARRTCADDMVFLQFPGVDKVQPTDGVQLERSPRFFGNIVLMASREWFDPFLRRFNFLGTFPLSAGTDPCSSFQSRMTRLGSQICNLRLDRTEAAILAALNVVGAEDGSGPNLSQASRLPETIIKVLGCYLYTINVDPYERIPELLSVMPKVHLMTMWYSNLVKNVETNTSRRGERFQDFTATLSPGGKLAS